MNRNEQTYFVQLQEWREVDSALGIMIAQLANLLSRIGLEKTVPSRWRQEISYPPGRWQTISNHGSAENLDISQAHQRAVDVYRGRQGSISSRRTQVRAVPSTTKWMINKMSSKKNKA